MAFALIANVATSQSIGTPTDGINTVGADLLVAVVSGFTGVGGVSDNKGNTWTPLTTRGSGSTVRLFYAAAPTVGAVHTFNFTAGGAAPMSLAVAAFSGSAAVPFDVENGGSGSGASVNTGSVTPSQNGELLIAGLCFYPSGTVGIGGGFAITNQIDYVAGGGGQMGVGLAYLIQTNAAPANPAWGHSGFTDAGVAIATFKTASPPPLVVFDEADWYPLPPPSRTWKVNSTPPAAEEDTSSPNSAVGDSVLEILIFVREWAAPPTVSADEDPLPVTLRPYLDHHEPWIPQVESLPWAAQPFTDDEITFPLRNFARDQEEYWTPLVESLPWAARPFTDDEISTSLKNFAREQEEYWIPQVETVVWQPKAFSDDEAWTGPASFGRDQEEPWVAAFENIVWQPKAFSDDEIYPTIFFLDHDEAWIPQVESVTWSPRAFLDDETSTSLKNFYLEQEEPWTPQVETISWYARPFSDDETSTSLSNFARDQEEYWTPLVETVVWQPKAFSDDEIMWVAPVTGVDDDPPFDARVMAVPWSARPFSDDETSASLKNFFLDQEDWSNPGSVLSWSRTVTFDDDSLAPQPAALDEAEDMTVRPGVTAWNRPAAPADEVLVFLPIVDYEEWTPYSQPLVWAPRIFADDDLISSFGLAEDACWEPQPNPKVVWVSRAFLDDEFGPCFGTADLRTGLGAYYRLDFTLADSSGNGRDMTPGTTPVYGTPGRLGPAYLAAGTGTVSSLSVPYTGLTVSCWVHFDNSVSLAQGSVVFTTPAGIFGFRPLNNPRTVQVRLGTTTLLTSPAVSANTWHHFAATCDAFGNVTLYVDGVTRGTTTGGPTPDTLTALGVAASVSLILLDEVAFYTRALCPCEVGVLAGGYDPTAIVDEDGDWVILNKKPWAWCTDLASDDDSGAGFGSTYLIVRAVWVATRPSPPS